MQDFAGRVAVVTGGASGIGRALERFGAVHVLCNNAGVLCGGRSNPTQATPGG